MRNGLAEPGFATTIEALRVRDWLLGPGQPTLVLDQFTDTDWKFVVDDLAHVHVNSRDGRVYTGYFPGGRPGADNEEWKIAVTGTSRHPGWSASFGTTTPAEVIATLVTRLIDTTGRVAA